MSNAIVNEVIKAVLTYIVENGEEVSSSPYGGYPGLKITDGLTVEGFSFDVMRDVRYDYYSPKTERLVCEVEVRSDIHDTSTFYIRNTFAEILVKMSDVEGMRL